MTTLTGVEDNYGQLKADITAVKADRPWANILHAQSIIDKERQVLQTYLCKQNNAETITMVGKVPYSKKKGGYQPGRIQKKVIDSSEMLCFKCEEKGHLYLNCLIKSKVECARCGKVPATRTHDDAKLMKGRMAAKDGKAAWRN